MIDATVTCRGGDSGGCGGKIHSYQSFCSPFIIYLFLFLHHLGNTNHKMPFIIFLNVDLILPLMDKILYNVSFDVNR